MFSFLLFLHLFVAAAFSTDEDLQSKQINGSTAAVRRPRSRGRIWQPQVGSRFQIVLSGVVDIDSESTLVPEHVDIWDIDLFDTDKETIDHLKRMGKKIICYFSAGTSEDWRPDFEEFKAKDQGGRDISNIKTFSCLNTSQRICPCGLERSGWTFVIGLSSTS
jgi:hypothetical protein